MGALRSQDIEVRAFVRDAAKAQGLEDQGAEIYVGDLSDPDTIPGAFEGSFGSPVFGFEALLPHYKATEEQSTGFSLKESEQGSKAGRDSSR